MLTAIVLVAFLLFLCLLGIRLDDFRHFGFQVQSRNHTVRQTRWDYSSDLVGDDHILSTARRRLQQDETGSDQQPPRLSGGFQTDPPSSNPGGSTEEAVDQVVKPDTAQRTQGQAGAKQKMNLPSHVGICLVVMTNKDIKFMEGGEHCLDENDPTASLAQIFLSSYLTHQARLCGYRVEYEHNCPERRKDRRLIQELLTSPLEMPKTVDSDMTKGELQAFCRLILEDAQKRGGQSDPLEVLMWETSGSPPKNKGRRLSEPDKEAQSIPMLQRLIPLVRANLYHASMQSRLVKTSLQAGYGVLRERDSYSDHIAVGRAVIHLPCRDRECRDIAIVPYTTFLLQLPLSVHIIDIVANPKCLDRVDGCRRYVGDLASNVRQFSPRMEVEVIPALPSSPDTIARLVEAEYVLCAPGFGMTCLFPALSRTDVSWSNMILLDVSPGQIEGESVSSLMSRLPTELLGHVRPPTAPFTVAFLSAFEKQQEAMARFAQSPPSQESGDCRFFRGRLGQWAQDMKYAEHAQYRTPLSHYSGNSEKFFRQKVQEGFWNMRYRPSTTYRWEELRYESCPITQITQDRFCDLMKSLGARRVFVLGDSSNLQLAQSMWMWLSRPNAGDTPNKEGTLDPNFKATIRCGFGENTLQFIRNDELLENSQPVSIDERKSNCDSFCYPWTKEYLTDKKRTILIVNAGAHIHRVESYQAAIDRFIQVFDGLNRANDIVLFRSLVPGHWECGRKGLKPFRNFEEYSKDAQDHPNPNEEVYTWSKFRLYNDYAVRALEKRRFRPSERPQALMEVVDVFPMTVLRPDGHCSDEFRPPSYLANDCLHYTLPGPIDWWTHLAFSHLQDVATAESYLARQYL